MLTKGNLPQRFLRDSHECYKERVSRLWNGHPRWLRLISWARYVIPYGMTRIVALRWVPAKSMTLFTRDTECFACLSHCLGVRLSVRLFVTQSRCCIVLKRCKLGSRNPHCGCPKDSSFWLQNFVRLGKGVPLERERQRGVPLKNVILRLLALIVWKRLQIGTVLLHIITSTGHWLFSFINIDDLELPWTPRIRNFCKKFLWFWATTHFKSELHRIG